MDRRRRTLLAWTPLLLVVASGCQGIVDINYDRTLEPAVLACTPGAGRCDGPLRRVCDAAGSKWVDDPCDATRPYCTGEGECICVEGADEDLCTLDTCNEDGDLVVKAAHPGFPCDLWQGTPSETSCARDFEGAVRCWGSNAYGQLGRGFTDEGPHATPLPVPIDPVRSLALGDQFACALLRDGAVQCWGRNDFGQARGAEGDTALEPVLVPLPGLARKIATGSKHACALLQDTTIQCWGENVGGQLGDGTTVDRPAPAPVLADPSTVLEGAVDIALGYRFSCALLADGAVKCWGDSLVLGIGVLGMEAEPEPPRVHPVLVIEGMTRVSAGVGATCALDSIGDVWCWGLDVNGETGDPAPFGGLNGDVTTLPHRVEGIAGSLRVSAAFRHACATHSAGVSCWGGDFWGQLGNGGSCAQDMCGQDWHSTPQPVQGLGPADEIATGFLHTCTIANGALSCWGRNASGQLGDGTTLGADQPVEVHW